MSQGSKEPQCDSVTEIDEARDDDDAGEPNVESKNSQKILSQEVEDQKQE